MVKQQLKQQQEVICINVDKVYDWIVKENDFDFTIHGDVNVGNGGGPPVHLHGAKVTCSVVPAPENPIVILSRENRTFCFDGKTVVLQQLNIKKNFLLTLHVTLHNCTVLKSEPIPISRCERVVLCAPEGTDVEITYTKLDCFVCSHGEVTEHQGHVRVSDVSVSIATCQSIQSTFPVTVEFLADFCEPREDFATSCPSPGRPRQCPSVFPD